MTVKDFREIGNMGEVMVVYKGKTEKYYNFVHELGSKKVWELYVVGMEAKATTRIKKNTNDLEITPYTLLYLSDEKA